MHPHRWATTSLALVALALATGIRAQSSSSLRGAEVSQEIVGRWALIATLRNSEDVTRTGVTQGGRVSIYDFRGDGTFTISVGDSAIETGTWTANARLVPKTFDHIPNVRGAQGPFIPGIYEAGGTVLKICLFPPSAARTRPAKCEANATNRSSIYIMQRDQK